MPRGLTLHTLTAASALWLPSGPLSYAGINDADACWTRANYVASGPVDLETVRTTPAPLLAVDFKLDGPQEGRASP